MEQRKFAHAREIHDFDWQVVLSRNGRVLFRSHWAQGNVSGAIDQNNRSRAISEAERWAEDNGYAGLVWDD